jgi:phage-related protein
MSHPSQSEVAGAVSVQEAQPKTPEHYLDDLMSLPKMQRALRLYAISLIQYHVAYFSNPINKNIHDSMAERLAGANHVMHIIEDSSAVDRNSRIRVFHLFQQQTRDLDVEFTGGESNDHQIADCILERLNNVFLSNIGGCSLLADEALNLPIDEQSVNKILEITE